MNVSEFIAMTEEERRAYFAEMCAKLDDDDVASELVGFISSVIGAAPEKKVIAEVTKIVHDIRAGERLRLSRLQ